jgi:hypothetical protein
MESPRPYIPNRVRYGSGQTGLSDRRRQVKDPCGASGAEASLVGALGPSEKDRAHR